MKKSQSSLFLYIIYKYLFAYMIVLMILGATKQLIITGGNIGSIKEYKDLLILIGIFFLLQIAAQCFIFRATVNKEEIVLNNARTIKWDNVEFVSRLHQLYILKTKDKQRYYVFPTERQLIRIFGDKPGYTDMDQIINLKRPG